MLWLAGAVSWGGHQTQTVTRVRFLYRPSQGGAAPVLGKGMTAPDPTHRRSGLARSPRARLCMAGPASVCRAKRRVPMCFLPHFSPHWEDGGAGGGASKHRHGAVAQPHRRPYWRCSRKMLSVSSGPLLRVHPQGAHLHWPAAASMMGTRSLSPPVGAPGVPFSKTAAAGAPRAGRVGDRNPGGGGGGGAGGGGGGGGGAWATARDGAPPRARQASRAS